MNVCTLHNYIGKKMQKCTSRESNPGRPRGRRAFYHWTTSAHIDMPSTHVFCVSSINNKRINGWIISLIYRKPDWQVDCCTCCMRSALKKQWDWLEENLDSFRSFNISNSTHIRKIYIFNEKKIVKRREGTHLCIFMYFISCFYFIN